MTTEIITKIEPSPELLRMIANINQSYGNLKNAVMDAYNLALEQGFTPQEAKKLLLDNVEFLSQRSIYRYLPDEAKDQDKSNAGQTRYSDDSVANWQHKDTQKNNANIENISTNQEDGKVAELEYKLSQSQQKHDSDVTVNRELMNQLETARNKIKVLESQKTELIPNANATFPNQELSSIDNKVILNAKFFSARASISVFMGPDMERKVNIWIQKV